MAAKPAAEILPDKPAIVRRRSRSQATLGADLQREDGAEVFETVVVGADASDTAAEAVRQAIELVKLTGGRLHIVSAYKQQQFSTSGGEEVVGLESGDLAESVLADHGSRARAAGIEAQTHARSGAPADVICEVAKDVNADLIVVGNKGMIGMRRVLGSVPNSVAHHAPCSVLIAFTT
jgi:nucleotide-binding universal stress UspA family protein